MPKPRPHRKPTQEVVARGVFVHRGYILLAQLKGESWYFLPGGGVERGETAAQALHRELREELHVRARSLRFIGVIENRFAGGTRYEVNLVFTGALTRTRVVAQEGHLVFSWHPISALAHLRLFPESLPRAILKWHRTQQPFIMSEDRGTT